MTDAEQILEHFQAQFDMLKDDLRQANMCVGCFLDGHPHFLDQSYRNWAHPVMSQTDR